jgi:hypothetical protein
MEVVSFVDTPFIQKAVAMKTPSRLGLFALCSLLLQACATPTAQQSLPRPVDGVVNLGAQAIPACHETDVSPQGALCVFAPREALGADEHRFRTETAGEPDWRQDTGAIGVALSGGGTRAAAIAMGVLAGLDDLGLLTHTRPENNKRVEAISSVSGGGYAAYYLFSHLLHPAELPVERGELFQDCVSRFEAIENKETYARSDLVTHLDRYMCTAGTYALHAAATQHAWEGDGSKTQARHQAMVRCQQDVLQPSQCSSQVTSQDKWDTGFGLFNLGVASVFSMPLHHLANSLFDSGLNFSPSRAVYVSGINTTYGGIVSPSARPAFKVRRNGEHVPVVHARITCPNDAKLDNGLLGGFSLFECDSRAAIPTPRPWRYADFARRSLEKRDEQKRQRLSQVDQGAATATQRNHPYWIIQATSAPSRGLLGWVQKGFNQRNLGNDTFEFTPTHFGSRRYGFVPGTPAVLEVVDAVASAAAFLDSNQQQVDSTIGRPLVAAGLHLVNANWGYDIANYNTSSARRTMHRSLPFPLNNLDALANSLTESGAKRERLLSTFIRLTDGGNTENLGAYALVRRGIQHIVVSDGAQDNKGRFSDLCTLKQALNPAPDGEQAAAGSGLGALHLYMPGLDQFKALCEEQELTQGKGYPLMHWSDEQALLLGCIQSEEANDVASECADSPDNQHKIVSRLYVYKPALRDAASNGASASNGIAACKVIDYSPSGGPTSRLVLASRTDSFVRCTEPSASAMDRAQCQAALPCEVARLIRNKNPSFPIGDAALWGPTVAVTANSSGTLFASYRELARHAMHESARVLRGDQSRFQDALERQRLHPMRLCPTKGAAQTACLRTSVTQATHQVQALAASNGD